MGVGSMRFSRAPWFTSLLLLAGGAIAHQSIAASDAKRVTLHIPPQPVGDALSEFGRQTGLTVMIQSAVGRGMISPQVEGDFTPGDALDRLLTHTGLHYEYLDARTVAVVGPAALNEVTKQTLSAAPSNAAEDLDRPSSSDFGAASSSLDAIDESGSEKSGKKLQEVIVTGTHIRGATSASPVTEITQTDIERSGLQTTPDLIRSLPQNFAGGNNPQVFIGSGPGNGDNVASAGGGSAPNLRGLGSASTLTLVDGHRLGQDVSSGAVDISSIPLEAIDRVEVVTDGASAVYGSDAVAGVVNFILKKDFAGLLTTFSTGSSTGGGGTEKRAGVTYGNRWNSGSGLISYEYDGQTPVYSTKRGFTGDVQDPFTLLPDTWRHSVFGSVRQQISDSVVLLGEGLYTDRHAHFIQSYGPSAGADDSARVHSYTGVAGVEVSLPRTWSATAFVSTSSQETSSDSYLFVPPSTSGETLSDHQQLHGKSTSGEASANGELWSLPAGATRLAVGAGYRRESFEDVIPTFSLSLTSGTRNISYVFGELAVPLWGQSGGPRLHHLELNVSGRSDHYSDFGRASVPKIGLTFFPLEDLKLRATWGKSFRTPSLSNLYLYPYITLENVPDPASSTGNTISLIPSNGNPHLRPETARSWTTGVDFTPEWAPNLTLSGTYFNIDYTNRIQQIGYVYAALSDPTNAAFVTRSPTPAQQQLLLNEYSTPVINLTGQDYDPATVGAIINDRFVNVATQRIHGVDLALNYSLRFGAGMLSVFENATFLSIRRQLTPEAPETTITATAFNPPKLRSRGGVTWSSRGWSETVILNYTSGGTNTLQPDNPPVATWTTIDAQVAYAPAVEGVFHDLQIAISAQNILDRDPPYLTYDGILTGFHYDTVNNTPMGRFVNFQISKKF